MLNDILRTRQQQVDELAALRFEAACAAAQELIARVVPQRPDRSAWARRGEFAHAALPEADEILRATGVQVMDSHGTAYIASYGSAAAGVRESLYLPNKGSVPSSKYYLLLFHELAHWTGRPQRLNRAFLAHYGQLKSQEEFVAEAASLILSQYFGIGDAEAETQIAQSAQSYLQQVCAGCDPQFVQANVHNLMSHAVSAAAYLLRRSGALH